MGQKFRWIFLVRVFAIVFAVSITHSSTEYAALHPPQTTVLPSEIRARGIRMTIHTLDNLVQGIASSIGHQLLRLKGQGVNQEGATIQWLTK